MTWDVILCLQNIDILPVLLELHENVMGSGFHSCCWIENPIYVNKIKSCIESHDLDSSIV